MPEVRYRNLRGILRVLKGLSLAVLAVGAGLAVSHVARAVVSPAPGCGLLLSSVPWLIGVAVPAVLLFGFAELIQVILDIEANTRLIAERLIASEHHQRM